MRKFVAASCLGLAVVWSLPAWANGQAVEESLRALNDRIKELEQEVARLKQAEAPAAQAADAAAPDASAMLDQRVTALEDGPRPAQGHRVRRDGLCVLQLQLQHAGFGRQRSAHL